MARAVLVVKAEEVDNDVLEVFQSAPVRIYETDGTTPIAQSLYLVSSGGVAQVQPLIASSVGILYIYADTPQECRISLNGAAVVTGWFEADPADIVTKAGTQTITGAKTMSALIATTPAITQLGGTPSAPAAGLTSFYSKSSNGRLFYFPTGGAEHEVADLDSTQTFATGKTHTTPVITNPTVSTGTFTNPRLITPFLEQVATPSAPAAGLTSLFASTGGIPYYYPTGASEPVRLKPDFGLTWYPEDYGAKADAVFLQGAADCDAGVALIFISGASLTSADAGKTIGINGAGAGAGVHATTIASVQDSTHCTLTVAPITATTPTGNFEGTVIYGTNSTTALNQCWRAMRENAVGSGTNGAGGVMYLSGAYLAGNIFWCGAQGCAVTGPPNIPSTGSGGNNPEHGSFIYLLPGATGVWIDISANRHCLFSNIQFGGQYQHLAAASSTAVECGINVMAAMSGYYTGELLWVGPPTNSYSGAPSGGDSQGGIEMTEVWMRDCDVRGYFSHTAMYWNGAQIGGGERIRLYNHGNSATSSVLHIDGYNSGAFGSPGITDLRTNFAASPVGNGQVFANAQYRTYYESRVGGKVANSPYYSGNERMIFRDGQIHDQSGVAPSNLDVVKIDGGQIISFEHIDSVSSLRHVSIYATSTTASNLPKNINFYKYNFDNQGGAPAENILLNSNVTYENINIENCRHDVVVTTGAIIKVGGGTSTKLKGWRLTSPDISSIGVVPPTYLLDASANNSANVRLEDCYLECAGLALITNGSLDGNTVLKNPGALTLGSGFDNSLKITASGIRFPGGSVAAPSLSNTAYTTTGLSWPTTNTMAISANAAEKMRVDGNGVGIGTTTTASGVAMVVAAGTVGNPSIGGANSTNTGISWPAAGAIALSGGGAEKFRVNNTGVGFHATAPVAASAAAAVATDLATVITLANSLRQKVIDYGLMT